LHGHGSNLPDFSGYELLQKMADADEVSFPPVIVYTAAPDRRRGTTPAAFLEVIIIKDARSPERLLDEVTLFLHQVEATLPAERQRMLQLHVTVTRRSRATHFGSGG